MPSEREEVWVDEMDGPERHERAKKRRAEQLKRWERRENTSSDEDVKRRRTNEKVLKFVPNVVILEAAARNDLDEVARLLESGVSPDLANEDGLTALHQSCIDGCDDMVKYLIEHNANVNACDRESWTPLHAASACNHMSIIQYLCENGGNILALNLDGNFPVDLIESNEEVEKYLEQELSKLGYNDEAIEELRQNQGKQLFDDLENSVKNGRNLDIQDDNGATAFHVAAAQGWTNVVNYLLENEADFEIRDDDGWQPIHAAATWGHDDVLEILVASGADLDATTNNAETPLDLTEEDEIIELIEELKTKEVNYPRKGKGVRRRRSNTNTSIKRSSIHEKNELSHADTKAEGAALFIQLQNTEDSATNSPDDPAVSPSHVLESHLSEQASNSSREETSSSGYHSEGSTKSEEKTELSRPGKTTDKTKEKAVRNSGDYNYKVEKEQLVPDKKEVTVKEEKLSTASDNTIPSTNIKQSPVPKPPRLMREPKPYINLEIGPLETAKDVSTPVKRPENDTKKNAGSENVEPKNSANKTELNKTPETRARVHGGQTTSSERRTTPLLPKLASSDKRRAPEPPDAPTNAETRKQSPATAPRHDSASRKKIANRPGSADSSNKKSCIIV